MTQISITPATPIASTPPNIHFSMNGSTSGDVMCSDELNSEGCDNGVADSNDDVDVPDLDHHQQQQQIDCPLLTRKENVQIVSALI